MSISARSPQGARSSEETAVPSPGERRSADRPFAATVAPADARRNDATALHSRLLDEFAKAPGGDAPRVDAPAGKPAARLARLLSPSPWTSRIVKSAIGLALLIAVGVMPAHRLFQVSSVEAIVNARLVTMRAPIDGVVTSGIGTLREGSAITDGMALGAIANPRADHGRVDLGLDRLADARAEREAKLATLTKLRSQRATLSAQLESFRASRIRYAKARVSEAQARITSAIAAQERATTELNRKEQLRQKGSATKAEVEIAARDAAVADAALDEARAAKSSIQVELDALESGGFFGDDYNDEPRTAQRLDEIDLQVATMEADLIRLDGTIERANAATLRETAALELDSKAELRSPVAGRVWQVLTAPGEQVVAGQELFSLLDCSRAIVTSVVSEATYNSLSVGMPATFTFRDGGAALAGRIVQLSGAAEASSNYAIAPSALAGDTYRVSVAIDTSQQGEGCNIGRTGRVVFQTSGS